MSSKHQRNKDFSCDICLFKTTRKDNLFRHIRKNHGSKFIVTDLLKEIIGKVPLESEKKSNERI